MTVHGQTKIGTFGIIPKPATDNDKNTCIPAVEESTDGHNNKEVIEVFEPATGDCVCITYHFCNNNDTDGTGIIDIVARFVL